MSTTKWVLDPTHSEILFKVKHLMITNVTGNFAAFNAEATSEDDAFSNANISFTAQVASISTNNEQRDGHLKSADFFDVAQFPEIKFSATGYQATSETLTGDLTIKGITKNVTLQVEFAGTNQDPWGNTKAGFTISGKINRTDFGLTWNAALETGGVLVSEEVRLNAEVQLVKVA